MSITAQQLTLFWATL